MKVPTTTKISTNSTNGSSSANTEKVSVKDIAAATSALNVIAEATKLIAEREKFETEVLARSNDALYELLTKVYELFVLANEQKCIKQAVLQMRNELKKRSVKVQSNTPAMTVFVRFIFNSDRKRAYNYASTLMAAAQAEIQPSMLSEFIKKGNGVEECKKEFKKKDETRLKEEALKEASLKAFDKLSSTPALANVTLPNASVHFDDGVQFAFIVARSLGNGNFELVEAVPTSTKMMQKTAIKEIAKTMITGQAISENANQQINAKTAADIAATSMTAVAAAKMTIKELEAA